MKGCIESYKVEIVRKGNFVAWKERCGNDKYDNLWRFAYMVDDDWFESATHCPRDSNVDERCIWVGDSVSCYGWDDVTEIRFMTHSEIVQYMEEAYIRRMNY